MKRSCKGCKALSEGYSGKFICNLGYKIEQILYDDVYSINAKPKEECPKPKTYGEYLNLKG